MYYKTLAHTCSNNLYNMFREDVITVLCYLDEDMNAQKWLVNFPKTSASECLSEDEKPVFQASTSPLYPLEQSSQDVNG